MAKCLKTTTLGTLIAGAAALVRYGCGLAQLVGSVVRAVTHEGSHMARKNLKRPKHIHRNIVRWHQGWLRDKLKELEVGREEFARYIVSVVAYDEEWARNDKLFVKIDVENPKRKDLEKFHHSLKMIERRMKEMFSAYDFYQRVANNLINVPEDEIRQIILDALSVNTDALPENWRELTGFERYHGFMILAGDIIEQLKSNAVRVEEADMEAVYCADCDPVAA